MSKNSDSEKHWYDANGVPHHGKSTKDAKALGLYPSVTEVLKVIRAPFLEKWFVNEVLSVAYNTTAGGMPLPAYQDHCRELAWSVVREAANKGKEIHAAVEAHIKGASHQCGGDSHAVQSAINAWDAYASENLVSVIHSELTFGDDYYEVGGTIDLVAEHKEHGLCILDIKTQDFGSKGKPKFHPHYTYQLAAYADCYKRRMNLSYVPRIITLAYPRDDPFPSIHQKVWSDEKQKQGLAVFESARALHRALST